MFGAQKGNTDLSNGKGLRIGIVQARFNESVTNALAQSCKEELVRLGVDSEEIEHIVVPGALEVPIVLQLLASQDSFDALIALGCVIRGETYHFELVSNESAAGISRTALDYELPIINAILTVETQAQAQARQTEKGCDAARNAIEMAHIVNQI